jgi:hypothetical protein
MMAELLDLLRHLDDSSVDGERHRVRRSRERNLQSLQSLTIQCISNNLVNYFCKTPSPFAGLREYIYTNKEKHDLMK